MSILWKDIPGYEGLYRASSEGDIFGVRRGKILASSPDHKGYLVVCLSKEGKARPRRVHSLVALAFYGKRPEGMHTRHLNCIKTDNRKENLKYGTVEENAMDSYLHGKYQNKPITSREKLTARRLLRQGKTQVEVARILGVTINSVHRENKLMQRCA